MGKGKIESFLIDNLNSGRIRSLQWTNRNQQMFSITTIHLSNHHWTKEDGQLYKSYAELDKEIVKEDYSTYRKQFFDALNESKKFKRCTRKEINGPYTTLHYYYLGNLGDPVLPDTTSNKASRSVSNSSCLSNQSIDNYTSLRVPEHTTGEGELSEDLDSICPYRLIVAQPLWQTETAPQNALLPDTNLIRPPLQIVQVPIDSGFTLVENSTSQSNPMRSSDSKSGALALPSFNSSSSRSEMSEVFVDPTSAFGAFLYNKLSWNKCATLKSKASQLLIKNIQYSGKTIEGSCNYYDRQIVIRSVNTQDDLSQSQESQEHFLLPAASKYVHEELLGQRTTEILKSMEKGVLLVCEGVDVYAINECSADIKMYASSGYYEMKLLENSKKTKIFDMETFYGMTLMNRNCNPTVYISIGKRWSPSKPKRKAIVLLSIESSVATTFQQMMSQSNSHSSILSSTSWSNEMEDALPNLPSQTVTSREATTLTPQCPFFLPPS